MTRPKPLALAALILSIAALVAAVAVPKIAPAEASFVRSDIQALRAEIATLSAAPQQLAETERTHARMLAQRWTQQRFAEFQRDLPAGWRCQELGPEGGRSDRVRFLLTRPDASREDWTNLLSILSATETQPCTRIDQVILASESPDGRFSKCLLTVTLHFAPGDSSL